MAIVRDTIFGLVRHGDGDDEIRIRF